MDNNKMWYKKLISEDEAKVISTRIAEIERAAEAEIIPIVANSSLMDLSYVSRIKKLWLDFILMIAMSILLMKDILSLTSPSYLDFAYIIAAYLCIYSILFLVIPKRVTQKLFSTKRDLQYQVDLRAELEFYRKGIGQSKKKAGILVYVSFLERRTTIIFDEVFKAKISEETITDWLNEFNKNLKNKSLFIALEVLLNHLSEFLIAEFKRREPQAENEFTNEICFLE